jgi:hypothetical protein
LSRRQSCHCIRSDAIQGLLGCPKIAIATLSRRAVPERAQ